MMDERVRHEAEDRIMCGRKRAANAIVVRLITLL